MTSDDFQSSGAVSNTAPQKDPFGAVAPWVPRRPGVYLVGGCVRDLLTGRQPRDYDIVVQENPENFAARLAARHRAKCVRLGKAGHPLFQVLHADRTFEVVPLNGISIEADLERRDITINAIAYDLMTGRLIDPTGGRGDLQRRVVRMVAARNLEQDPVRLLRVHRIAAQLAFAIDPATFRAIEAAAPRIRRAPGERVREEFEKLFQTAVAAVHVAQMMTSGVLTELLPELAGLSACSQNRHHDMNVWEHTHQTLAHLERLWAAPQRSFPGTAENLRRWAGPETAVVLKWAALLHDIGKPATRTVDERGCVHFYGHASKSAEMLENAAIRLRFPNRRTRLLTELVRHHLRPGFLYAAKKRRTLTEKAVQRLFLDCRGTAPGLIVLAAADACAKRREYDETVQEFIGFAAELLERYFFDFTRIESLPPLLTGKDLIREFGLSPSPEFKKILRRIEAARACGEIHTRPQALQRVGQILSESGKTPSASFDQFA